MLSLWGLLEATRALGLPSLWACFGACRRPPWDAEPVGLCLWGLLEALLEAPRALGCRAGKTPRCRACGAHTRTHAHTRPHTHTTHTHTHSLTHSHTHTLSHSHTLTLTHSHTHRHTRTELCFRGTGCLPDTFSKAFNGTRGWSAGSPAHSHSPTPSLTYSLTRSPTVFAFPIDARGNAKTVGERVRE